MTEQGILWKQMVRSTGFRSKLHDPAIADWTIERLKTAKVMADSQLVEDIVGLFDKEVLHALFQVPHCRFLHHALLVELPAPCFAGMEDLLLKLIEEQSEFIQGAAMPVFAALEPQACVQMLREKSIVHFHTVSGCVKALTQLDQESQKELLPGFLKVWLQLDLEGHHYSAIGEAVALAHSLAIPGLFDLLSPRMNTLTRGDSAWLDALSKGLFSGPSFFTYVHDYQAYTDIPPPADFAWMFRRDAPLRDLDELLKEKDFRALQDKLKRYAEKWPNPLLEFYLRVATQFNKRASNEAKTMFGLFVTGLRLAAWQSESVSFAHLMLDEIIRRLLINLEEVPHADEIAEQLKAFPRDLVVERVTQTLEEQQQNFAVIHLIRALKRLPDSAFVRPLLHYLADGTDDGLLEAAKETLTCIGPPAAEHIIAVWEQLDDCQQLYGMGVVELAESGQAVEFLLARWPTFNTDEEFSAREMWCRLAMAHPEQRLLACLEPLLKQGESIVQESFYQLCKLLDFEHPNLDELRTQTMENRSKLTELVDSVSRGMNDITAMVTDTISLRLQCPACGGVERYEIEHVFMSSDGVGTEPYIGGDIECKACGASPDFELTSKGKLVLMAELMKVKLCSDEKKSYEGPLTMATFVLYDGRVVSPQQALQYYRSKVKQNPKDLSSWLSLANLCDNLRKYKRAFSHFQKCLELDPTCPEAAVNVATYLDMQKDLPGEAWETLTACLTHYQQWKFHRLIQTSEREFVDKLLLYYAELCERLSLPNEYVDLSTARFSSRLRPSVIRRSAPRPQLRSASREKVGRNQPCPCGSGRKYKKCCMP